MKGFVGNEFTESFDLVLVQWFLTHKIDPKKVSKHLMQIFLGIEDPHPDRLSSLLDYLKTQHNQINNETVVGLLTLITAMPEYQLC